MGDKKKEYRDEAFDGKGKKGKKQKQVAEVKRPQPKEEKKEEKIKQIVIPEVLTIKELADKMKIVPSVIVKKLFLQGKVVTVNQEIDYDTAEEIAMEFEVLCEKEEVVDVIEELLKEEEEDDGTHEIMLDLGNAAKDKVAIAKEEGEVLMTIETPPSDTASTISVSGQQGGKEPAFELTNAQSRGPNRGRGFSVSQEMPRHAAAFRGSAAPPVSGDPVCREGPRLDLHGSIPVTAAAPMPERFI